MTAAATVGVHFDAFAEACRERFASVIVSHGPHLFTVDAGPLYQAYLDALPSQERQHHTCHCCRQFIERYGHVVAIDFEGKLHSAIWPSEAVAPYDLAAERLKELVENSRVTGVFLSSDRTWGTPLTGDWTHFAIKPSETLIHKDRAVTTGQAMAQKSEDFKTLLRALGEFSIDQLKAAANICDGQALTRTEKVAGPIKFLLRLLQRRDEVRGRTRDNITWSAVASAPPGWATPRSTMAGSLLEDIAAGKSFDDIKRAFDAKMAPDRYQRPQAAPTAGNIAAAEKLVADLGVAPSLNRRYATLDEIETIWRPQAVEPKKPAGGVFGNLTPKGSSPVPRMTLPTASITWVKFARDVLPTASKIELFTMNGSAYCAMLTAVHSDAPPILQWDQEDNRNPFSWYVYANGSPSHVWGLPERDWVDVTAITLKPNLWRDETKFQHHGLGAIFLLKGAQDSGTPGLGLFPEIMRSELHPARSTLEAFSAGKTPEGRDESNASGVLFQGSAMKNELRVTTENGVAKYLIDRWE